MSNYFQDGLAETDSENGTVKQKNTSNELTTLESSILINFLNLSYISFL